MACSWYHVHGWASGGPSGGAGGGPCSGPGGGRGASPGLQQVTGGQHGVQHGVQAGRHQASRIRQNGRRTWQRSAQQHPAENRARPTASNPSSRLLRMGHPSERAGALSVARLLAMISSQTVADALREGKREMVLGIAFSSPDVKKQRPRTQNRLRRLAHARGKDQRSQTDSPRMTAPVGNAFRGIPHGPGSGSCGMPRRAFPAGVLVANVSERRRREAGSRWWRWRWHDAPVWWAAWRGRSHRDGPAAAVVATAADEGQGNEQPPGQDTRQHKVSSVRCHSALRSRDDCTVGSALSGINHFWPRPQDSGRTSEELCR